MSTNRFKNSKATNFINSIPQIGLINPPSDQTLADRCKFNFSYFTTQNVISSNFSDLSQKQLSELLDKLKHYSRQSLFHWSKQRVGGGSQRVLAIYGQIPKKSDYTHPKHVPHDADWARFRLEGDARLIGFVVPSLHHQKTDSVTNELFDSNTFYVVFVDLNHRFYISAT